MKLRVNRRRAITGILAGGAVAAAAITIPLARRAPNRRTDQLVISGWGGSTQQAMREAYFDPFTKETGIEVVEVTYGGQGLARLKTQIMEGGAQVDILDGAPFWPAVGAKQGLLDRIELPDLPIDDFLAGSMPEYSFGYATVSWGITYNTAMESAPRSWSDFWDIEKMPGRRAFFGPFVARHPEYALMAAGTPVEDVYPLDERKIETAFQKLAEIKPSIDVWYQTGAQCEQLLANGEIDMAEFFNGRAYVLRDQGYPIEYVWNQAVMNVLPFLLAKGAPNKENALRFLSFVSRPEQQAVFAGLINYGPTNKRAFDLLDDQKVLERLPTYEPNFEKQIVLDGDWWGRNLESLAARWSRLIVS